MPAATSFWNCRTIGSIPPSSTTKPRLKGYELSNLGGQDETILRLTGSSLNFTSLSASGPATFSNACSSSRTVAVKPGRQMTRVCLRNLEAGTCLATMKFLMVVSGEASQEGSSSSGESMESPMGQSDSRPLRGSRMTPMMLKFIVRILRLWRQRTHQR